ncbi:MAG: DUF2169 domain-containing protein [Myxococcota bacterium]
MRIISDEHLAPGFTVSDIHPFGLTGTFFVKGHFRLELDRPVSAAEEPEPPSGDVFENDDPQCGLRYPNDFAPLKPRGDVLVVGGAYSPNGTPTPVLDVAFRVGNLKKQLRVTGDRGPTRLFERWRAERAPESFTSLPLSWTRARGGDRWNPAGCGRLGTPSPNQVNPAHVSGPAGARPGHFGPVAANWTPRDRGLGRYRGRWQRSRWPWLPENFDYGHFNAAPMDQQIDGYLHGDEEIELHNLHPEHPRYRSQLPGLRVRCFLSEGPLVDGTPDSFREVPLVLDTLWIDSVTGQVLLVWRGHVPVRSLKLEELEHLYIATEPLSETPFPAEIHREGMAQRLASEDGTDADAQVEQERARRRGEIAARIAEMEDQILASEAAADSDFAEAIARLEADLPTEALGDAPARDPAADLEQTLAWLASPESDLEPEMTQQIMDLLTGAYESGDEGIADAPPPWTRERVQSALDAQESLAGTRLSELDLSGLDFSDTDLRNARMDGADLRGSRFRGARMDGARLARANAEAVDFRGSHLREADFSEAVLGGACFAEASIEAADFSEATLDRADFSGCDGAHAIFVEAGLVEARFIEARLESADLTGARMGQADFSGANLEAACIEEAVAQRARFDGANLTGIHASDGADLREASLRRTIAPGSTWQDARLDGADLRGSAMRNADFSGASLEGALLSRADLAESDFDDTSLQRARMDEANLLRTSFARSDLRNASLEDANAYAASTWDTADDGASFDGANLRRTELGS